MRNTSSRDHFGLMTAPFASDADPSAILWTRQHSLASCGLTRVAQAGWRIAVLSGPSGTGKSLMVRHLMRSLPSTIPVRLLENFAGGDLSHRVAQVLGIEDGEDGPDEGRAGAVLVLDNAHRLLGHGGARLDILARLTDLGPGYSLILVGEPSLRDGLSDTVLARRNVSAFELGPLSPSETSLYVTRRMAAAGATREIFEESARIRLHKASGGIPARINLLGQLALEQAAAEGAGTVDDGVIARAIELAPDARVEDVLAQLLPLAEIDADEAAARPRSEPPPDIRISTPSAPKPARDGSKNLPELRRSHRFEPPADEAEEIEDAEPAAEILPPSRRRLFATAADRRAARRPSETGLVANDGFRRASRHVPTVSGEPARSRRMVLPMVFMLAGLSALGGAVGLYLLEGEQRQSGTQIAYREDGTGAWVVAKALGDEPEPPQDRQRAVAQPSLDRSAAIGSSLDRMLETTLPERTEGSPRRDPTNPSLPARSAAGEPAPVPPPAPAEETAAAGSGGGEAAALNASPEPVADVSRVAALAAPDLSTRDLAPAEPEGPGAGVAAARDADARTGATPELSAAPRLPAAPPADQAGPRGTETTAEAAPDAAATATGPVDRLPDDATELAALTDPEVEALQDLPTPAAEADIDSFIAGLAPEIGFADVELPRRTVTIAPSTTPMPSLRDAGDRAASRSGGVDVAALPPLGDPVAIAPGRERLLGAEKAPLADGQRVVIHHRPEDGRRARALIAPLAARGFRVELHEIGVHVARSNIRYFYGRDSLAATAVGAIVSGTLGVGKPMSRDFSGFRPLPSDGTIELWLGKG